MHLVHPLLSPQTPRSISASWVSLRQWQRGVDRLAFRVTEDWEGVVGVDRRAFQVMEDREGWWVSFLAHFE